MAARKSQNKSQKLKFIEAAEELQCDESEAAFDAKLGKLAQHNPVQDKPKDKK